MFFYFKYK